MTKSKHEWPGKGYSIAESGRQFREMIDALPATIYITDADGCITYFNPAASRFSGSLPEPGTGQWYARWELFYPDGAPMPYEAWPMALALKEGRSISREELMARMPDGRCIWVEAYASPVHDEKGNITGSINMLFDITEQKKAVQDLHESEERYRTLFESMDEAYCIVEVLFDEKENPVDYRFVEINPAFEKQTGLKNAQGKRIRELAPNHEEHWFEIYGKVARTGEPVRFESHTERPDERWYHAYAFRFGEPEERQVAVLFRNITKRKENERTSALLGAIVDSSDDAIISKDLNGIITSWNKGAERMFGYTEEEIVGRPITLLIPPDRISEETDIMERLKQGDRTDHFETIRLHKDGTPLDISLTVSPVQDSAGKITGASKIARDITRQKRAESELEAMNETLEERVQERTAALLSYQAQLRSLAFELSKAEEHERQRLAGDLHDNLGQMLAVGKMKLDLLQLQKGRLPDPMASDMDELAELMDDAIRYTRELMSDLKPPPSLDKEDLSEGIRWVADKMKKHKLDVTVEDDGQPKPLNEEVQTTLRQCVRELLFNVVKHAGVREARVVLSRADRYVQVVVEDKGKGFSLNGKEPIPTEEGGFGLFNINERMDLLGGSLEVISRPGKGTKMILRAPLEDKDNLYYVSGGEENGKVESVPPDEYKAKPKVKVLLVDDHQMMREGLRKMIEDEDDLVVIAEASDGKDAVKLAGEASPDVIVMDVNMPGMNGIEATRQIAADMPHMRIIGLSLQQEESVSRAMRSAGASAYLTKSEVFETLCATIRSEAALARE